MPDEKFSERGVIPLGTVTLTIGVDSQSDGFYFLLACWGRKMEVWLPLTGRITGDMRADAVWKALLEVLTTTWLDKEGNGYLNLSPRQWRWLTKSKPTRSFGNRFTKTCGSSIPNGFSQMANPPCVILTRRASWNCSTL
jgi:hypothetical protein